MLSTAPYLLSRECWHWLTSDGCRIRTLLKNYVAPKTDNSVRVLCPRGYAPEEQGLRISTGTSHSAGGCPVTLELVELKSESARIGRRREEIQKRSGQGSGYDSLIFATIIVGRVDRPTRLER